MNIEKNLVSSSKYGIKCPYTMNPKYITVHNTYNDASAENEVKYMISNNNEISFHIAVDDKRAIQGIPLERNAWACGDGNGNGNRQSISVEICYSLSGGDRYYKSEENAVDVVRQLMAMYNIPIENVRTHQSWSGKYCPHRMLAEGRWDAFIQKVKNGANAKPSVAPETPAYKCVVTGGIGLDKLGEVSEKLNTLGYKTYIESNGKRDGIFSVRTDRVVGSELDKFTAWLDAKNWWYQYE
ncbi:N-acetylmuramoyl-L-alanine amidase [Bacillus cereus]|nr:N-acetylmuramoyl-L-alanine amidase [Bacillus cereus]